MVIKLLGEETQFDMDSDMDMDYCVVSSEDLEGMQDEEVERYIRQERLSQKVEWLKHCLDNMVLYQPKMSNLIHVESTDMTKVSPDRRNQSAYNLKSLASFYGYSCDVFALALNILDRFITKVKVQPRYLSCITVTCFYHAIIAINGSRNIPRLEKVLVISQSECRPGDIERMEKIIVDKLRPDPDCHSVTAHTILQAVYDVLTALLDGSSTLPPIHGANYKLRVCLCDARLLDGGSPALLALSVLSYYLTSLGEFDQLTAINFSRILAICQVEDREFLPYLERVTSYLDNNYANPQTTPRSQLKWTISNRTMSTLRPSHRWATELPVIHESSRETPQHMSGSLESLPDDMEIEDNPGTPTPEDFSHHFSYPNSPSEGSPISRGLPVCPLITYADIVSGRVYRSGN